MRPISARVRAEIDKDPLYKVCARQYYLRDHVCQGRITYEHAVVYGGKQVDERWAIVPICAYAHGVDHFLDAGNLVKDINVWIALNRMTPADEAKYPRRDWARERRFLNGKYGSTGTGKPAQSL